MKVLVERDQFLSDYEVLNQLNSVQKEIRIHQNEKRKKPHEGGVDLETIARDTITYLNKRPCSNIQNEQEFGTLMKYLNTLNLVKVEKLQIMNSLPRSMVHLYALIEECDSRFDSETCESIINKINELPIEEEENDET